MAVHAGIQRTRERTMPPSPSRRRFLRTTPAAAAALCLPASAPAIPEVSRTGGSHLRLGLAAYSLRDHLQGRLAPSMTLHDFIERSAAWGVDAVELTSYYFPEEITPAYVAGLKRHCFLLGLDVSTTPIRNTFTFPAGPERDEQLAHTRRWLDIAADLGSPAIRIFAGDARPGQSETEARRHCVETIAACCEHAAKRGVFLALENHHGVVGTPDGLLEIVKAVDCEWFGVNLDSGNFWTADPYADVALCAPYAVTAQIKVEMNPDGKGKVPADLGRVVRILRDAGYRGYATLEYEADEAPLTAIPRHLEQLRAALREAQ
jgi:sugar phosphate isomerase/epimerase